MPAFFCDVWYVISSALLQRFVVCVLKNIVLKRLLLRSACAFSSDVLSVDLAISWLACARCFFQFTPFFAVSMDEAKIYIYLTYLLSIKYVYTYKRGCNVSEKDC